MGSGSFYAWCPSRHRCERVSRHGPGSHRDPLSQTIRNDGGPDTGEEWLVDDVYVTATSPCERTIAGSACTRHGHHSGTHRPPPRGEPQAPEEGLPRRVRLRHNQYMTSGVSGSSSRSSRAPRPLCNADRRHEALAGGSYHLNRPEPPGRACASSGVGPHMEQGEPQNEDTAIHFTFSVALYFE
jgi:hypothetical protein